MIKLTDRKKEILRMLANGYSNPAIAEKLCISIETVKKHVTLIFAEFGVKNRVQLVICALKDGLINLEDLENISYYEEISAKNDEEISIADDKGLYQINITEEQIVLLHRLFLSAKKISVQHSISEYIDENGTVQQRTLKKCCFCQKGSYDTANDIDHDEHCLAFEVTQEWAILDKYFVRVLNKISSDYTKRKKQNGDLS